MTSMVETAYTVYRWEDETMVFQRHVYIKHPVGEQVTRATVLQAVEQDRSHFTEGLYRAVPSSTWVDFEVKATVVLW